MARGRHNTVKRLPVNVGGNVSRSGFDTRALTKRNGSVVKKQGRGDALKSADFDGDGKVSLHLNALAMQCKANELADALIPWFCDRVLSPESRRKYYGHLRKFLGHMQELGIHPYAVTADDIRRYKEALTRTGSRPATIAAVLTVIRGTYEQFGEKGNVPWPVVGDIQSVSAPPVDKNTTPAMSEKDACRFLHAPDMKTLIGCRDHAMLFAYFKTAYRSAAIANATVGDLVHTDTEWSLRAVEKGNKKTCRSLLEAAPAVLHWLAVSGISLEDQTCPLFPAFAADKKTLTRQHLTGRAILKLVKKYALKVGLRVSDSKNRAICTHSIRKSAAQNALENGAALRDVQVWLNHADIRTTQTYTVYTEEQAVEAARRSQIR